MLLESVERAKRSPLCDAASEIKLLKAEALQHRAVHHPYLAALASGELPSPTAAIADFALQYQGYSSWFQRFLTGVIHQLDNPSHRKVLIRNLAEECGSLDPEERETLAQVGIASEWVDGIPHPQLYERFLEAIGMNEQWRRTRPLADDVVIWRSQLLHTCTDAGALVAVGALGLGTELVVAQIYSPVVRAISQFLKVSARDRVFFDLHCNVDDAHGEALEEIAVDLVQGRDDVERVRLGMITALTLRAAFFDGMWRRALDMKPTEQAL